MGLYYCLDFIGTLTEALFLYTFNHCFLKQPRFTTPICKWITPTMLFALSWLLTWFSELGAYKTIFLIACIFIVLKLCYKDSIYQMLTAMEIWFMSVCLFPEAMGMAVATWIYGDGMIILVEGQKILRWEVYIVIFLIRLTAAFVSYQLVKNIRYSICENMVTVIKASSGQGKTTLALRAAYILQNEYIPYQLLWCDEIKEIGNIVQYFKARIQLGEKILILIDNLDNHLSKWNYLVQLLQSELHCHYKLLITSREMDWYNYSGDLSNIQSLKVIKPVLEEKEAIEIFNLFREAKQLHPSITSWQRAWNKIAERQLLIEYIVRFRMVESQDQVKHEMTKQEAQALVKYNDDIKNHRWASKPQIRKYDKVYNGKLRIVFGERSYIRDNDSEKLEDRLGDILVTLYEKAEENRIVREAREEAERKRVEEARRREENRQRKEQEIRLVKELVNKAEDYRIAKEIREYIQAMIDSGNEDITPAWIEWARKKADWYDPSIATEDEYLGKRQHEKNAEEKEKSLQDSIRKSWYW